MGKNNQGGMKLEIYLIRHAKSEKSGGGQKDTGLSEHGEKQTIKIGRFLSKKQIDKIYSSPLKRAKLTAMSIASYQQQHVFIHPLLMERTHGILDGLTNEERLAHYPSVYRYLEKQPTSKAPGGETYEDVKKRVVQFIETVIKKEREDARIVIVSHGEWLNIFMHTILKLEEQLYPAFHFKTSSYSLIEWSEKKIRVRYLNRDNHL